MKVIKCKVCSKEFPKMVMGIECPDCYIKGALMEKEKEMNRILKLIDEEMKEYDEGWVNKIFEELKSKIEGMEKEK